MGSFFNTILYQPILQLLVWIYHNLAFNDLGLAIIFLTVGFRLVLYPLFHKSTRSQIMMQRLHPHIEKIRQDHKDDKQKQAAALLELYREHKINPFSGFLLLIVQLPILIALYRVFLNGLSEPLFASHMFLNLIDLANKSMLMVILAALAQYWQGKLSFKKTVIKEEVGKTKNPAEQVGKIMIFVGPLLTVLILSGLPSAVGLYWLTSTLFSVGQQYLINNSLDKK